MAIFNIAAGHGKTDSGAVGPNNRYEKDDNVKMAVAIGDELAKRGHTVRQFRNDDSVTCGWQSCRKWLESNKADFSLVVHRNAFNGSAHGVEVWSYDGDKTSTDIATEMSAAISRESGLYNRGRKGNGAAWLSANVPCCQPEIGFIDNASDNTKYDKSFGAIVTAVCDVLEKRFGTVSKKGTDLDGVIAVGTTTNYLNIRKSPVNGAVLTSMPTGSKCNIYSIENGWAKISYNGYEGYSSTDYMTVEYVEKEEPETEQKPVSAPASETPTESEDIALEEIAPKKEETAKEPENTSEAETSLDDTVPAFIKLLKKIIEIIVKIWRK